MKAWLRTRLIDPLKAQLQRGVTPGALAMALALGIVLGTFPVLGTTTLLCAAVGAALKLNQPAIQVANYAASPLQLLFYVPFLEAGAQVYGAPPLGISVSQVKAELSADLFGTMGRYAAANARAVTVWAVVAPFAVAVLFYAFRLGLRRVRLG